MVKNLKLKVKNTQLAAALKFNKPASLTKKKTKAERKNPEEETETKATEKKRKARIIPKVEKEKPVIPEESEPKEILPIKEIEEEKIEVKEIKPEVKEEEIPSTSPTTVDEEKKPPKKVIKETKKEETVKAEENIPKKGKGFKEFKDFKQIKKTENKKSFDSRDRQGLRSHDDGKWRKARHSQKSKKIQLEESIIRPTNLKVKLPILLKDLAAEMKRKSSELISKLFLQGIIVTLNDALNDDTTVQLLGEEFGCQITIDTSEEKRLRITEHTIKEEIKKSKQESLIMRAPVITFMGHVDHGKTSLIDAIRKSNITAQEAGEITQHIGAFRAKTPSGSITILDTPGHEAFSEMRSRGALITDIIVLVIAGDEGIRDQTIEAINLSKEAKVPIVVAINKMDKPSFDSEKAYRQLADNELLPEAWGGTTITVNCSAKTKDGISTLLEMISLQAEVLELRADANSRARGTILESQMHKGLGAIATVLVQNGTLHLNDAIVFGEDYGRIKTMHNEHGLLLEEAGPSMPVKITGLSDLAEAGDEFIVVSSEKEARSLAEARREGSKRQALLQYTKGSLENLLEKNVARKTLTLILRADVQGSLEALKTSLTKIKSKKIGINIISAEVGEISESDIQLADASKAVIIGFHTCIESHAESLIKETKVDIRLHDIIYHAIDDVKELMVNLLDKVGEEHNTGKALVKTVFKSSHLGNIAGCQVTEGIIKRNDNARVIREGEVIWTGKINSLKRVKEDVKEVSKGLECGILLEKFSDVKENDIIESFEILYHTQEL